MNKILAGVYLGIILMAVGLVIGASGIVSETHQVAYYGAVLIFVGIMVVLAINTKYVIIFIKNKNVVKEKAKLEKEGETEK